MQLVTEIAEYYDSLAKGYHRQFGYDKEYDTEEYKEICNLIADVFTSREVLEIACGTGYWTGKIAKVAKSVMATDLNSSMLTEAKKNLSCYSNISFTEADAYSLKKITSFFSGAISVLWWCHVPKKKIPIFLSVLHSKLKPGARVLHICQLEDSDSENHTMDQNGDAIAQRKSEERIYRIVKNIPTEHYLREILGHVARDVKYSRYPDSGLWSVAYTI
jgi:demethylmenaquinone methyltransferase/2-methoxy-6-polyprenyl-1,4-benzoquinol methylase